MSNLFDLLRNRKILDILDGDTELGNVIETQSNKGSIKNSMPYLGGRQLCEISNKFGLPVIYGSENGSISRWMYLDKLIAFCIENGRISDLISFLFSKEQFADKLAGYMPETIEEAYRIIINSAISIINGHLSFGGNELVIINHTFVIKKKGETTRVVVPSVKAIDRNYIFDLSQRAIEDIEKAHYDSAITKCRTMLEEVFCYKIEKKGSTPSTSGDIGKLYSQVKNLYEMHPDKAMDNRINMLLSGLEKILKSITEMRNETSDSHGVGSRRVFIAEHHARLFLNSAIAMADFLLSID